MPRAVEATIGLFENYEGQETFFSMLLSADIQVEHDAATYWLEQIFYKATNLKTLSLTIQQSPGQWLSADRVIPKLQKFTLSQAQTAISADDLLAMISCSMDSLTHLRFRSITLTGDSWRNVLSFVANEYRNLRSFELDRLRERKPGQKTSFTLDFGDARDKIPKAYLLDLNFVENARFSHKPVASLKYDGPHAGPILELLASQGKAGVFKNLAPLDHVVT